MDNMISGYAAEAGSSCLADYSLNEKAEADGHFAEMMAQKTAPAPGEMTLAEYKVYFHEKLNSMYTHPSQSRVFRYIDITDAAYRRMQADPAYEQKILNFLEQDQATDYGCRPPRFVCIRIEDTWEKCTRQTLGVQESRYEKYAAAKAEAERRRARKERRKKLLKLYLKKKAEAKKLQDMYLAKELEKKRLEHIRLEKEWDNKRRRAKASRAYEASQAMRYR